MSEKDLDKGYVALLGWALGAMEAAENFDRREDLGGLPPFLARAPILGPPKP